jgi:hypothetical protein
VDGDGEWSEAKISCLGAGWISARQVGDSTMPAVVHCSGMAPRRWCGRSIAARSALRASGVGTLERIGSWTWVHAALSDSPGGSWASYAPELHCSDGPDSLTLFSFIQIFSN